MWTTRKIISILIALSVYCCLHLLAYGNPLENRNRTVNKGRACYSILFLCVNSDYDELGRLCRCWDPNDYTTEVPVAKECYESWPETRIIKPTGERCEIED